MSAWEHLSPIYSAQSGHTHVLHPRPGGSVARLKVDHNEDKEDLFFGELLARRQAAPTTRCSPNKGPIIGKFNAKEMDIVLG